MTDAFTSYQQEYLQLRAALQRKLDSDVPQLRGEERKAALRRISMELDEVDEIVDQLELEGKGKAKLMTHVRAYKTEVKGLKAKASTLSAISDRDLLLSSRPAHSSYPIDGSDDEDDAASPSLSHSAAQRARLLQSTQTLSTSSGRLDNAHRLAAENEEIGQGVLSSLVGQRMQLVHANEQLLEADGSIDRARGTIGRMIRLAYRQRIVIGLFIVVLLALIGLILWSKFR
ncbi:t-SNARE VTI1 [Rhodotorula kratochvilovae]